MKAISFWGPQKKSKKKVKKLQGFNFGINPTKKVKMMINYYNKEVYN